MSLFMHCDTASIFLLCKKTCKDYQFPFGILSVREIVTKKREMRRNNRCDRNILQEELQSFWIFVRTVAVELQLGNKSNQN